MNGDKPQFWYWRMVTFKGINGYLIVVLGALCAAGCFSALETKWILCFLSGSKFIEGFLDQEVTKAKDNVKRDTELFYPANILKAAATTQPATKGSQ